MRFTLVRDYNMVSIDGEEIRGIDLSPVDKNIFAVQWYETWGVIEYNDGTPNEKIHTIENYQFVIDAYKTEKIQLSKPNEYSTWNKTKKIWVDNAKLKTEWQIKKDVSIKKEYLKSTDWYYARLLETGEEVPKDVEKERKAARTYIQENKDK